ncbi:MAG: MBL fold metallo-hydrolase [Firmicutes bacterium]|nr:MBL fold metallo-hydrolase [Bacillota bacterium]
MEVKRFVVGEFATNCYLLWSPGTRQAMVVDPGAEPETILAAVKEADLSVVAVVNTHGHGDHIMGNAALLAATGAELLIGAPDAPFLDDAVANLSLWLGRPLTVAPPHRLLHHGDVLTLDRARFVVLSTPGHTPGSITLYGEGLVLTGDTLFAGGIGRTDLPGGDEGVLLASISRELLSLPDETRVLPGHGPETTIGRERLGNPFLVV